MGAELAGTVRRNTLVLAASLMLSLAVWQLIGTLAPIATERLTGSTELAGVGLSIAVLAGALAAVPMGRFMDARGRVPGISLGFAAAAVGAVLLFAAGRVSSPFLLLAGFAALGAGLGAVGLARVAAADMYPPHRRASGIGYVLAGAAAGALGGLLIFTPILRGRVADAESLSTPWLVALALLVGGAALVWLVRVDPIEIGRRLQAAAPTAEPDARRGLLAIFAEPGPRIAFVGALVAYVVMAVSMPLMALVLHHRGHDLGAVSAAFGAHLFGMYALAPVIGRLVDRVGRVAALVTGLLVLAVAVLGLLSTDLSVIVPAMFCVGVGWNVAYVSATALVADGTSPRERAGALGAVDLCAVGASAVGAALSPALLGVIGLAALAILAALTAALPIPLIARMPRPAPAARTA